MNLKKHKLQLRNERKRMADRNRQFKKGLRPTTTRFDREMTAYESAVAKLKAAIEKFEHGQIAANEWISFRRIAEWRAGKGELPEADKLAAAYVELRGKLRDGEFHKGDDLGLMILLAENGDGPSDRWYPTLEECRQFIDAETFKKYGDFRVATYLACIVDETRLVGGAWLRRDLAAELFRFQGWSLPAWLAQNASTTQKRGPKPRYDRNIVRELVFKHMEFHGEFTPDDPEWRAQADLEKLIVDELRCGESTARELIASPLGAWRKHKNGSRADN
jgi:hypothetical protein